MFEIVAINLVMAQERGDPKDNPLPNKLWPGDIVLVQNHTRGPIKQLDISITEQIFSWITSFCQST